MLEALGNLGDFVGGLGVIVTLIYLAVQIRRNTAALQTTSRQEIASGLRAHVLLHLEPGASSAYAKGLSEYPDMPFDEKAVFWNMLADHALFFQSAFALHESGQLEDETFQAYLSWLSCHVATPGGTAWWADTGRAFYTRRMVEAVDARLSRGDLPDIRELSPYQLDGYSPRTPERVRRET